MINISISENLTPIILDKRYVFLYTVHPTNLTKRKVWTKIVELIRKTVKFWKYFYDSKIRPIWKGIILLLNYLYRIRRTYILSLVPSPYVVYGYYEYRIKNIPTLSCMTISNWYKSFSFIVPIPFSNRPTFTFSFLEKLKKIHSVKALPHHHHTQLQNVLRNKPSHTQHFYLKWILSAKTYHMESNLIWKMLTASDYKNNPKKHFSKLRQI